jgi:hypothetical protein
MRNAQRAIFCDACHEMGGMDYIETVCTHSSATNPLKLAHEIMRNPTIKMHGPEHHYLVPAVLLTAYYNATGETTLTPRKLKVARERAANILGGFCRPLLFLFPEQTMPDAGLPFLSEWKITILVRN